MDTRLLPLPPLLLLLDLLLPLLLLPLPLLLLLLLLTEVYQKHLPAPKQQGTEGRTGSGILTRNPTEDLRELMKDTRLLPLLLLLLVLPLT